MSVIPARVIGAPTERLDVVPAAAWRAASPAIELSLTGRALVPASGAGALEAVPDGNRSVIVPGVRAVHAGREWMLSVKGAGAQAPLYGVHPRTDVGPPPRAREITDESWMGESPYGAQSEASAAHALEITALAGADASLGGVAICPLVAVATIPDAHARRDLFWYRRHHGPLVQEHRLVPSDVRLFHGVPHALGRDVERALAGLGAGDDLEALDAFIDRFLASGIAALTLWARTARACPGGLEGLDYEDAWLDKDALVAPDGTLMLVDLESLAWTPTTHRDDAAARIRRQIERNAYELLYGADALLDARDARTARDTSQRARRESLIARVELALAGDPWVRAGVSDDGLDLEVRATELHDAVRTRLIDRREGR